jgi:hypothetical protein
MNNLTLCFWISAYIAVICCAILFIKVFNRMNRDNLGSMKLSTKITILLFVTSIFCLVVFGCYSGLFN